MSKVLAIDTSTSRTSVAIIDNGSVLYSGFRDGATAHGPSLPALVQEALAVSDVDEVVVGMGPGPFTGLRVGIAFAQSFALARAIPVWPARWNRICTKFCFSTSNTSTGCLFLRCNCCTDKRS